MTTMNSEVITVSKAKIIIAFGVLVASMCGTFYGGIEIAKSHADAKVQELRNEQTERIESLSKSIQLMSERQWTQSKDIEVIRTILEERFGRVGHVTQD